MVDLRPISLCNVIYKIVAKILANRLKVVLPNIISPTQEAFVAGRSIFDNILISNEILHYLHRKTQGRVDYAAWKVDMEKAYDRMEWAFLEKTMYKMGFHEQW